MALEAVKFAAPLKNAVTRGINKISDNKIVSKIIDKFEPTGANNSFLGLTSLMVGMVIVPRVLTAAKRNPGNKEATKDEIKEILFRDIQTVAIILFALKSMDSVIGRLSSKISGLPLTNKAYKPVFGKNQKFTERAKNALLNIKDTIHPTGGLAKYTNKEIAQRYSNYTSIEQIQKLFKEIPEQGGDNEKVFSKIIDNLIEAQKELINKEGARKNGGIAVSIKGAKKVLNELVEAKKQGWQCINDENLSDNVKNQLVGFFQNPDNALVKFGKKLSAGLRTAALGIEVSYLGFGLPALNQKRLEKKYLGDEETRYKDKFINAARDINSSILVDKTIKPQEIALYHNFIK